MKGGSNDGRTVCDWCGGTGFIARGFKSGTCPNCLGRGEVEDEESPEEEEIGKEEP